MKIEKMEVEKKRTEPQNKGFERDIPEHIRENLIYTDCNLCGKNDYSVVYKSNYGQETREDLKDKFKSSGDETLIDQVVKCKNCTLIYINPTLNPDLIVEGYSEGSDELFVSQAKGRELTFRRCLDKIETFKKGGKILDIGAAGGSFLHVAKKSGWEVEGIEPNKWLCEWSKENYGIALKPGILENYKFPDNHFDVVTLWDVLEHVSDPTEVLTECNRILKSGGLLVINYPDIGSSIAKVMGRKWVFLLSVHLFYFTPKTIKRILDKTNFSIVKKSPHFQTLALGYLMFRMKAYSMFLHRIGSKMVSIFGLGKLQIPYWLGQTLIIARKK